MADGSKVDLKTILVGVAIALAGLATLAAVFYYIMTTKSTGWEQWQALGMLVVAVAIAFAIVAMLRYALAPLISTQSAASPTDEDAAIRSHIAPMVLSIGSIAIVALAAALIVTYAVLAAYSIGPVKDKIDTLLGGVFSTVLPVVATWVGTVLAFYFGSENFRQAAQSTREVLGDRLAPKKKITDVMVPYERIARLYAENEADAETTLTMLDVIHTLSAAATRVIVFNAKTQTPIYVIRSTSPPMPENWVTPDYAAGKALPRDPGQPAEEKEAKPKLKAYLNVNQNRDDARKFQFIDENATPEAALDIMKKARIDDLFITKDGQSSSRVLGWVATADLLKK